MRPRVTIVDYGLGNLYSISQALAHVGGEVDLTATPERIAAADRLVLPGVGAFGDGITAIANLGLVEPIKEFAARQCPMLGICLGMQLMFEESEEFGRWAGLGLFSGRVVPVPRRGADGRPHKVPHIGWNGLIPSGSAVWDGTILQGIEVESEVYFVHSFVASPVSSDICLAHADYDGCVLTAVAGRGPLFGCQFHPEKSGNVGLQILRDFLAI